MKTPGFRAIFIYRISNRLVRSRFRFLCFALVRIMRFTCNVDIEPTAIIGSGCRIPHTFSIVIGGGSVIGNNSTIMQGVTIGGNSGKSQGRQTQPIIGNDVFIGPGAKILGPISIGHKVKIGANAVVLSNIPDSSVAVGVPAIVR
jgi:serine O-acetyltransferase